MATHSSVFAWRIPETGAPCGLPSMGSQRVGHDWSDLAAAATVHSVLLLFFFFFCNLPACCILCFCFVFVFFVIAILVNVKWYLIVVLFALARWLATLNTFSLTCWPFVCFPGKTCRLFASSLTGFFCCQIVWILCIFQMLHTFSYMVYKCFLPFHSLPFHFVDCIFVVQNFLV